MNRIFLAMAVTFIFLSSNSTLGQFDSHRWVQLLTSEDEKVWYDAATADTSYGNVAFIWLLALHKPPLTFEYIRGKIYRSKTLYVLNLTSAKYGVEEVIYYSAANNELYRYKYDNNFDDKARFPYPIMENSHLHLYLKELVKIRNKKSNY